MMEKSYKILPVKEEDAEAVLKFLKRHATKDVLLVYDKTAIELKTTIQPHLKQKHDKKIDKPSISMIKTFFIDEPLNKAVGLCTSETDPCPELEEYCNSSMLEGFSFKASDDEGNIVGVMISGVCPLKEADNGNDLFSQAQRCQNPKFQKILYILARRESGARLWEKFPRDQKAVEVKVAATHPGWRKKGIMNALVDHTEKAIKEKGIRLARLDTSSAYSAMSAERSGYKCYYTAAYKDIKMDGKPLIVPEPPHVDDSVYIKELFPL